MTIPSISNLVTGLLSHIPSDPIKLADFMFPELVHVSVMGAPVVMGVFCT
jgi:hypothetical protein